MVLNANGGVLDNHITVNFETKYDNNHNEIKQLLSQSKSFDKSNWTHYVLLLQPIVAGLFLIVGLMYAYRRCWPILQLACRLQKTKQSLLQGPKSTSPNCQPPYAYNPHNSCPLPIEQYTSSIVPPKSNATIPLYPAATALVS
ncbi:unnamed protein product [Rotaria sp. Silwood2]|nr:unnamed protein product [Rotaria sp. Silwood2]CAF4459129.1 unnamed protein product [Rotaria sp. Silwood2]